jgi:thiamine-monophosphate kinase
MKSGAKQGDVIAVTGQLGLAASGFKVLEYGPYIDEDVKNMVIKHALEPEAKLNEGKLLSNSGYVSSATDITDGILSELGEIIDSNHGKVGIVLNQDDLPIPEEVFKIAEITDSDPFEMAMAYGEDFELVFTISPEGYDFLKSEINIYKIGQVDSSGTIKMIDKKGNTNIITPRGYEHLK